jgi:hypothetical protein
MIFMSIVNQPTTEGMPLFDNVLYYAFYYHHETDEERVSADPDRFRLATVQEQASIRVMYTEGTHPSQLGPWMQSRL